MILIKALLAKICQRLLELDGLKYKSYTIAANDTLTMTAVAGTRLKAITISSNSAEKSEAIGSFISGSTNWSVVKTATNITYGGTSTMTIRNASTRSVTVALLIFTGGVS